VKIARLLFVACMLAAGPAGAQTDTQAEIAFWETVRDSKNPAELQAYIDQYPNGRFVVLAKTRLAALGKTPAPQPVAATLQVLPPEARMPRTGDTWTYRLSFPRRFGIRSEPPRTHVIQIASVAEGRIVDQLSIDGGTPIQTSFSSGGVLAPQGVSIFSPYLTGFGQPSAGVPLGRVEILDTPCKAAYACEASARTTGAETVTVPAGKFVAIKIVVQQTWRSATGVGSGVHQAGQMSGGRTLTVWYAPEVKRAIKFSSRLVVGDIPPVEPHFDLELVSYQVK